MSSTFLIAGVRWRYLENPGEVEEPSREGKGHLCLPFKLTWEEEHRYPRGKELPGCHRGKGWI